MTLAPERRGHPDRLLLRKLRRDLVRQKWQFLAVASTIILGVALYAASSDAFSNLSVSYRHTYERLAFADMIVSGGDQQEIAAAVQDLDGVTAVSQRQTADVPIQVGNHKLAGRIVSLPAGQQPDVDKVDVKEGAYLAEGDSGSVLVEQHMASHFDLHPGDTLQVALSGGLTTVKVAGVVISAEYLWPARSRQEIQTTPDDFGVLFVPGALLDQAPAASRVQQVLVLYDPSAARTTLDRRVEQLATSMGATEVTTKSEQASNAALSEDLQGFSQLAILFPLLFLVAAGMATFVLMNRIAWSQRSIVGTLEANGLSRWAILRHYLAYGIVVGGAGSLVGIAAGVPLGFLITGGYTSALSIPDTVVRFHPLTPVAGMAFGLLTGAIAAIVPARMAMRVPPAEAMRGTVPSSVSGRPLLERLVPPIRRLPLRWRIPLRSATRARWRSVSTIVGVILALTLVLAAWGMIDTVQLLVSRQFDDIQHNDAQVFVAPGAGQDAGSQLQAIAGVDGVELLVDLPVGIRAGGSVYATQLQAFQAGTTMHSFLPPSGGEVPLPAQGILVGKAMEGILGVSRGDAVTLSFPSLGADVQTEIAGFVDEPLGTYAYVSQTELKRLLQSAGASLDAISAPGTTSYLLTYQPGSDSDTMRDRISASPIVTGVISSRAMQQLVDRYLALFYGFVGIMLAFGATMAFALMFNAISVGLAERSVEFATMRANGLTAGEVSGLLTRENLLVTLIGIPFGLGVGYETASLMMSSYSSDLFSFDLQMRWTTPLFAALAILALTLVSALPARRSVRRLDIARVVRERSQ